MTYVHVHDADNNILGVVFGVCSIACVLLCNCWRLWWQHWTIRTNNAPCLLIGNVNSRRNMLIHRTGAGIFKIMNTINKANVGPLLGITEMNSLTNCYVMQRLHYFHSIWPFFFAFYAFLIATFKSIDTINEFYTTYS